MKRIYFNYKKSIWIYFSLLVGMALFTSCEEDLEVVQVINEEFAGIESVQIESTFLDVNYRGNANATAVTLDALMESNKPGNYTIDYRLEQTKLVIVVEQTGSNGGGNNRGYINLTGPEMIDLGIEVGSGETKINTVQSTLLKINSGSGLIDLANISAPSIDLKVSSGNITGNNLNGNLTVEVTSGNTTLSNIKGNVNAVGSSGKLTLQDVEGVVEAKLSSGNMELDSVSELGLLESSSGNIRATNSGLSQFTSFKASSGNVTVQTFSILTKFNYDLSAGSGKVTVGGSVSSGSLKINNGAAYTINGTVSSGNIEIKN